MGVNAEKCHCGGPCATQGPVTVPLLPSRGPWASGLTSWSLSLFICKAGIPGPSSRKWGLKERTV